ncbi:SRPBCC family protein [Spirillospora albida]|uniref:SRPBCC family protein n=1 Tax=Spirillospora albida TaxID=58123 RepID=UPI0004C0D3F0|nr:SRPBCC family protein [Spirillospora albida]
MELDHDFTVPVPVDEAWSVLLDVERVALCMPGATLDASDGDEHTGRLKVKVGAMTITYRGTARIVSADASSRTVAIEAAAKEARGSGTANATVQARLTEEDGTTKVAVHTKLNVTGRPAQFGRNILAEVGSKLIARFAKALAKELESPAEPAPTPEPPAAPNTTPEAAAAAEPEAAAEPAEPVEAPAVETPRPRAVPQQAPAPAVEQEPAPVVEQKPVVERASVTPIRAERDDDVIDLFEVAGPSVAKRAVPAAGGLVALLLAVRFLVRRRTRGRRRRR